MNLPCNADLFLVVDPITAQIVPSTMFTDYTYAPYNPPQVYSVTKRATQDTYLVDIMDYGRKGSCTCDDFLYRRDPANVNGTMPHRPCKHLRAVRMLIANGLL
jgi:hypothetical protein